MKTVYIIIAFCVGLFFGQLFTSSEKVIKPPSLTVTKNDKKQLDTIERSFSFHQNAYEKKKDSLTKQLERYKYLLSISREALNSKRKNAFAIQNKIKHDTVVKPDSVLVDSLCEQINELNIATDSLIYNYNQKDSLLESMVAIRDTQIVACNKSYLEIKDFAQQQLLREQKLTEDLNTALKQQRRKRMQNKILGSGLFFVSGIAATLFIKSRQ